MNKGKNIIHFEYIYIKVQQQQKCTYIAKVCFINFSLHGLLKISKFQATVFSKTNKKHKWINVCVQILKFPTKKKK